MPTRDEETALQTDAYIEALLAAHAGRPMLLPAPARLPADQVRRAIELLESGLPRFHPSFRFEEELAARLRLAARPTAASEPLPMAQVISLPGQAAAVSAAVWSVDRRLLLGGAIASGVSLAGAAMLAWRRRDRVRSRTRWLA